MKRLAVLLIAGLVCVSAFAAEPVQRTLSFEERVKYQTAIERVYYSHQVGATKSFEEAVPKAVIEEKVRKYLEQSAALKIYWKTPVTDQSLQRELERMAQGTRMPERLLELYAALGNDPFLVKECLARATLVDRLTRNFYAFDQTLHAKAKAQAEELHRKLVSGELSSAEESPYRTVSDIVATETADQPQNPGQLSQQRVTPDDFKKKRAELPAHEGEASQIEEAAEAFSFIVNLRKSAKELRIAGYAIPKTPWDTWWSEARRAVQGVAVAAVASGRIDLPAPRPTPPITPASMCADDAWDNGSLNAIPAARAGHSAVWTGSRMIVWGGLFGGYELINTGALYDPATDSWTQMSAKGAPPARAYHSAIWTGNTMVIWGGGLYGIPGVNTGGRYDPLTDRWTPMSTIGAPSARSAHTAVWTGTWMVVWGGWQTEGQYYAAWLDTGGRYDPAADTWTPTSLVGAPSSRSGHASVWTGTQMLVWGGNAGYASWPVGGGRYDPYTDSWTPMSTTNAPTPRSNHTAVWTGQAMVVWGGYSLIGIVNGSQQRQHVKTGGGYDPVTDTWTTTSTAGAPTERVYHSAVWTGSRMVIWGGYSLSFGLATGAVYDPTTNSWTPTSMANAPTGRVDHTAIWTGSLMIAWGGQPRFGYPTLQTGGRYDPLTNSWTPTSVANSPPARRAHGAVWTGSLMVIWGGDSGTSSPQYLATGSRYDPATDTWTATTTISAPVARGYHSTVWTGSIMLVWGGNSGGPNALDTGGRYDPGTDTWSPLSSLDAPAVRSSHSTVWTGSLMVVWGGVGNGYHNTGGRYDPIADVWAPTSTDGAPMRRAGHTAVWTGSRMIVWGGSYYEFNGSGTFNDGASYDPASDTWTPMSTTDAPSARVAATSVWTGSRMVVWGGYCADGYCDTGGRYDPLSDSWTSTSNVGAASRRYGHTAVWTGSEMLIWGGHIYRFQAYTPGKRYNPATDLWTGIPATNEPPIRANHTAVWTGTLMIVWGGYDDGFQRAVGNGGRYFPGNFVDNDCDGDGVTAGDCDDHNATIYPGAPQVCDGVNNDCNDPAWPSPPITEYDADRDGVIVCNGDCDDHRTTVYPAAPQLCDGVNNDCDDPDWPTIPANESDADLDGARICNHDCDETEQSVGPGFWEHCDGLDNDCNGVIDDGLTLLNCEDHDPCTDDICAGPDGCAHPLNTAPCDDQNACTSTDACDSGACHGVPLSGTPCNDSDACTIDDTCISGSCSGGIERHCDDGDFCNGIERCVADYGCYMTAPLDCEDYNECTDDSCEAAVGCVHLANREPCNDNNVCTVTDICGDGSCRGTPVSGVSCTDFNICTVGDSCVEGQCVSGPPLACDDNNACNGVEYCSGGCRTGTPLYCDDNNVCTLDSCNPAAGCEHTNVANECSDGNACTAGDSCSNGTCQPGTAPRDCDDHNSCTNDSCDPLRGCRHLVGPNNTCSDNNPCTVGDYCWFSICISGTGTCDDGNPCTTDSCDDEGELGCVFTPNTEACDDGSTCTSDDVCRDGACSGTPNQETTCDDGNACTTGDNCQAGLCVSGPPISCDDNNQCTSDSCHPGLGCLYTVNPGPCDDGNACTTGDACRSVGCFGFEISCDDNNPCTADSCDSATGCVHSAQPNPCDDDNACTFDDICSDGVCRGAAVDCNDDNPCTDEHCDPSSGCVHPNNTDSCDDGNPCTVNDACGMRFVTESFDGVTVPGLPGGWTTFVAGNGNAWVTRAVSSDTAPNSAFGFESPEVADAVLESPSIAIGSPTTTLTFRNRWSFDDIWGCFDAAVLEIKIGSGPFADIVNAGGTFVSGGYTGIVSPYYGNPLGDRGAWCNTSEGYPDYVTTEVNLPVTAAGEIIRLRWRLGSDSSVVTGGQDIDSIVISDRANTCLSGPPVNCNDNNPCTVDSCDPSTGCVHTNNTGACDDGNLCTSADVCSDGACNGALVSCDDNNPCTDDSCDPATGCVHISALRDPKPQTDTYYRRLCQGPYAGDQLTNADAVCVASITQTFANISNFTDICSELGPTSPNPESCDNAEDDLMVLALNICRARVCPAQSINSQCGNNDSVGESLAESDALLRSPARNADSCLKAKCLDDEINTGRALDLNTLTLRRESGAVRLIWQAPYLDGGTSHPSTYEVWRRAQQPSLAPFTKIGVTTDPTFLDTTSGSGAYQYEVTAVMN